MIEELFFIWRFSGEFTFWKRRFDLPKKKIIFLLFEFKGAEVVRMEILLYNKIAKLQ